MTRRLRDRHVLRETVLTALVAAAGIAAATGCRPADRSEEAPAAAVGSRDPWQAARNRGVDYRAVGQEPGWYLEIDLGQSMRLVYDYGEREITSAVPDRAVGGDRTTYSVKEPRPWSVAIERLPCRDVMSGQPFADTVTVTIDGRQLNGCGQSLDTLPPRAAP